MKKENATLQQDLEEQKRAISEVEGALQSNLTLEHIRAKQAKLGTEEELGIEYDEDVGVSLQSLSELVPQNKKRGRGQ
ncbi:hypothetical protein MKX01_008773 [Papaver californicum]|nr:hypothetical protein MKX01_008773 [Papaver californicum]